MTVAKPVTSDIRKALEEVHPDVSDRYAVQSSLRYAYSVICPKMLLDCRGRLENLQETPRGHGRNKQTSHTENQGGDSNPFNKYLTIILVPHYRPSKYIKYLKSERKILKYRSRYIFLLSFILIAAVTYKV